MAGLNETPSGERFRIAFFGLRNAGKSTLVNAFTGQDVAIVSDVPGTTTDPVSKAMEILPLGPCLITDTAGLDDDQGELGALRVKKTLAVLEATDVAVWVTAGTGNPTPAEEIVRTKCARKGIPLLQYRRGDSVEALRDRIAQLKAEEEPPILAGLVTKGMRILLVTPQDGSAPKGRLILPQQQVIRAILDAHAFALVCQSEELKTFSWRDIDLVITDSQVFPQVRREVPLDIPLTSFSILFARRKGDLAAFCEGAEALLRVKDGDSILVAEGCTHRRQCGDIGTVKLPARICTFTKKKLKFVFAAGTDFPEDLSHFALVVQCGGCMLTRREVLRRVALCQAANVPIVNYGICLARCAGMIIDPDTCVVEGGSEK